MFKSCWEKMADKPVINELKDKVSLLEDCPVLSIPKLLEMMTATDIRDILSFDGFSEDVDEREVLEKDDFAYEDDLSDAADVFEENQRLAELSSFEKQNSAVAGPTTKDKGEQPTDNLEEVPPKAE